MANLSEDAALYKAIRDHFGDDCIEVHAVYSPSQGEPFPECYCAAVDLHESGETYKVFFRMAGNVAEVVDIRRWYFG